MSNDNIKKSGSIGPGLLYGFINLLAIPLFFLAIVYVFWLFLFITLQVNSHIGAGKTPKRYGKYSPLNPYVFYSAFAGLLAGLLVYYFGIVYSRTQPSNGIGDLGMGLGIIFLAAVVNLVVAPITHYLLTRKAVIITPTENVGS